MFVQHGWAGLLGLLRVQRTRWVWDGGWILVWTPLRFTGHGHCDWASAVLRLPPLSTLSPTIMSHRGGAGPVRMRLIRGSGHGGRERPGVSQGHSPREGLAEPTVPGGFTGRAGLFREGLRQCPGVSKVRSKKRRRRVCSAVCDVLLGLGEDQPVQGLRPEADPRLYIQPRGTPSPSGRFHSRRREPGSWCLKSFRASRSMCFMILGPNPHICPDP